MEDELSDDELDEEDARDNEFDFVDAPAIKGSGKSTTRKSQSRKKSSSNKQTRSKRKITDSDIVDFLSAKSKDDLVMMLMQVCRGDAKLRQTYVDQIMLDSGDQAAMIREAQQEIRSVTSEEAWYNSWDGHGNLPDYSRLQSLLRSLVDANQFDGVVQLGRELVERGTQQWNSRTMKVIPPARSCQRFRSLPKRSSLFPDGCGKDPFCDRCLA